jgi:hypothetical protein
MREPCSPFQRKVRFALGALTVLLNAFTTFDGNSAAERPGRRPDAAGFLCDSRAEDIQVVDIPEQALHLAERIGPLSRSLGKQDLDGVAKALQCHPEGVPRRGRIAV